MNKSRRLASELMMALAERGFVSCLPDLHGTGDSTGDFADADWETWQSDLSRAYEWLQAAFGSVTGLQATRLGAALATQLITAGRIQPIQRTVLWQPAFDPARHLVQFLRLKAAANLLDTGTPETAAGIRDRLRAGQNVEVAGYNLSAKLAMAMESCERVEELPGAMGVVHWMAIGTERSAGISPPEKAMVEKSRENGMSVSLHTIIGDQFWSSTETIPNPQLIASTVDAFCDR